MSFLWGEYDFYVFIFYKRFAPTALEQIGKLVYEIHGLTEEEIKIVEDER